MAETIQLTPAHRIELSDDAVINPVSIAAPCITKRAFLNRLTDAEAIAIDLASYGNTIEAATVRRHMSKFEVSPFVDLTSDDTINGLHALEAAGLLAAGRANEIVTTPVQDSERFNG